MSSDVKQPRLSVESISKVYPGVNALQGVSLDFAVGEVHGVIGENGAGKSTLMKILAGVEAPSAGMVRVHGEPRTFHGVPDALKAGIAMIHQELNLIDDLTVAENIFLGRELTQAGKLNRAAMNHAAQELLTRVASDLKPTDTLRGLTVAQKQMVEIAKALGTHAEVIIMDEPTAVLSERETTALFRVVHDLKSEGTTVILISHILSELLAHCDRISVLRDGEFVGTYQAPEMSAKSLAHLMVGRELGEMYPEPSPPQTKELLTVESLVPSLALFKGRPASLSVKSGEIVGVAGLVGSGRTELAETIMGFRSHLSGTVSMEGAPIRTPSQAIRAGLVYVSEDRKTTGLHVDLSVEENATLSTWRKYGSLLRKKREQTASAENWRSKLSIKVPSVKDKTVSLSGGNQQKVSLAKWLDCEPKVMILDEPTRGVDVGSKSEIYQIIHEQAAAGCGILMISSELQELIGMCHRIVVMRAGQIVGEVSGEKKTERDIMEMAAGVQEVTA